MAVLTAAYGRRYTSAAEVLEAYLSGKDFIMHDPSSQWDGRYCSKRDFNGEPQELRFGKNHQGCCMSTAWGNEDE